MIYLEKDGSPGRIRTAGQAINSRLLYRWATGEYCLAKRYTEQKLICKPVFEQNYPEPVKTEIYLLKMAFCPR